MIDSNALDVVFEYSRPMNQKDVIDNLKTLREMSAISLQSTIEKCPMVYDVAMELERIKAEGLKAKDNSGTTDGTIDNVKVNKDKVKDSGGTTSSGK